MTISAAPTRPAIQQTPPAQPAAGAKAAVLAPAPKTNAVADFYRFHKHKMHEKQTHVPWSSHTWAQTLKHLNLRPEVKETPIKAATMGRARSNSLPRSPVPPVPDTKALNTPTETNP